MIDTSKIVTVGGTTVQPVTLASVVGDSDVTSVGRDDTTIGTSVGLNLDGTGTAWLEGDGTLLGDILAHSLSGSLKVTLLLAVVCTENPGGTSKSKRALVCVATWASSGRGTAGRLAGSWAITSGETLHGLVAADGAGVETLVFGNDTLVDSLVGTTRSSLTVSGSNLKSLLEGYTLRGHNFLNLIHPLGALALEISVLYTGGSVRVTRTTSTTALLTTSLLTTSLLATSLLTTSLLTTSLLTTSLLVTSLLVTSLLTTSLLASGLLISSEELS